MYQSEYSYGTSSNGTCAGVMSEPCTSNVRYYTFDIHEILNSILFFFGLVLFLRASTPRAQSLPETQETEIDGKRRPDSGMTISQPFWKRVHRHWPFCSQRTRLLCSTGLSYSLLTHIILHQFICMKQTEAKKERSKEQWKREANKRTLTAIEHEEKESSSQKRRTPRA